MTKATRVKTYEDQMALPTGERFVASLPKSMDWKDLHGILYRTANREVTVTLRTGEVIEGALSESPGYFSAGTKAGARVWLRVPGRKTRKGVQARDIKRLAGYKAPSLAEALTSFVVLNSNNPSPGQVAEARAIARKM